MKLLISFLPKLLKIKKLNRKSWLKAYISLKDFTFKFKNVGLPLRTQNGMEYFFNNLNQKKA